MVLVAMGDHDRLDVLRALAQVGEVGQHKVDADHLRSREAQPDVDDDYPAVLLDDRHVLADLPQAAEGQDAQLRAHACDASPASGAGADDDSYAPSRPWPSSIALTASVSSAVASTSGRRRPPTLCPSKFSAALVQVG